MPLLNDNVKIIQKTMGMVLSSPEVIASRLWLYANPLHFDKYQQEYLLMFTEKQQAFFESIQDVHWQTMESHIEIANEAFVSWQNMLFGQPNPFANLSKCIEQETYKILDKGITPYSTRVNANNKRLNS